MFFRRKKTEFKDPIPDPDGNLYIGEGEDYDPNEYETDSDDSSSSSSSSSVEELEDIEEEEEFELEEEEEEKETSNNNVVEESEPSFDEKDDSLESMADDLQSKDSIEYTNDTVMHENAEADTLGNPETIESNEEMEQDSDSNDDEASNTSENATNDSTSNQSDESEEKQLCTTLSEKRSLLALAAEHDRVDIIKTILQSTIVATSDNNQSSTAASITTSPQVLIQLLLNNQIISDSTGDYFTDDDVEEIFVPPLHIAVASSSTNAATCLLRMGADPSIRPEISSDWDGPSWKELSNSSGGKDIETSIQIWKKLDGLTAWEVAFGVLVSASDLTENNVEPNKKSSWFGWSSKTNSGESMQNVIGEETIVRRFDIEKSKLESIKHGFTAEALRAIGSDEVDRLSQLVLSGMDGPTSSGSSHGGTNKGRGVEIGGKDLISWCVEMDAVKCSDMLRGRDTAMPGNNEVDTYNNDEKKVETTSTVEERKEDKKSENESSDTTVSDVESTRAELNLLEKKLRESKVLAESLSVVLDNLAEEVSLTRGLLYQHGDTSNSALLFQVRTLKETRGAVEDDISDWQGRLAGRAVELKMVLHWWRRKGGKDDDFNYDDFNSYFDVDERTTTAVKDFILSTVASGQSLKEQSVEMTNQIALCESKIRKLRSSIADLAEENSRNLEEVERQGLGGAVSLSRKLKEEVKESEYKLQDIKRREAAYGAKIQMIRSQLESSNNKDAKPSTMERNMTSEVMVEHQESRIVHEEFQPLITNNDEHSFEVISRDEIERNENDLPPLDDEEGDEDEEVYEDDCNYEIESYSESDDDDIPHSDAIKSGKSSAIVEREEGGSSSLLSSKIWDLLLRIVGLGSKAIKETAQSSVEDISYLPRAMIV